MSRLRWFVCSRAGTAGAVAAMVFCLAVRAYAQDNSDRESTAPGRIDFEAADLPASAVEIDLSQGMVRDLFGIGDAALAGAAETLMQSSDRSNGSPATRLAAEQLAAARKIVELASQVVQEARIRVYRGASGEALDLESLAARFDNQLRAGKWENVVRVRENEQSVRVSLLRDGGAVHGVFIIAGSPGREIVLANLVCDLSPENIKQLISAATKIGLENGLAQAIEAKMGRGPGHPPVEPPQPPQPTK
jgi:hypothetical protein